MSIVKSSALAWNNPVNGWHLFHEFGRGYVVQKGSARILRSELPDRLTLNEFVVLKEWRQNAIMADLCRKKAEWQAIVREPPMMADGFKDFRMPQIRLNESTMTLADLVTVQAVSRDRADAFDFALKLIAPTTKG